MADKTPRAWDGALEQEFYTPDEIAASDARVGKAHRMLYREKVIEGLEFTLEESGWDANAAYDQELMIQAVADAIALLKAQEPRVLSLEEVAGRVVLGQEAPIYMEFGSLATTAGKVIGLIPKYMYFDDEHGLSWNVCEGPDQGKTDGVSLYEYNDIWRCWTSRPTDEQREAAPWE